MIRNGVYFLYKGKERVCELTFGNNKLLNLKTIYKKELMPPFVTEKGLGRIEDKISMQQFLSSRHIPSSHWYYNLAKEWNQETLFSLLDDYYLWNENTDFDYFRQETLYSLSEDSFARHILYQAGQVGGISPNTVLPFQELSFVEKKEGKRYLLQEYSKELANEKKENQIPYTLTFIQDIPFISTTLQEGNFYPASAVLSKQLKKETLSDVLQKEFPKIDWENKKPDAMFLHSSKNYHFQMVFL